MAWIFTEKVKLAIFQTQKVIFDEFQTNNNGWSLLSTVSKSYCKCQLSLKVWGFCQLSVSFWPFVSCQLTPYRPSTNNRICIRNRRCVTSSRKKQELDVVWFFQTRRQCNMHLTTSHWLRLNIVDFVNEQLKICRFCQPSWGIHTEIDV